MASAPARRRPVRRATLSAERTSDTPASQRNSGAAKPPRIVASRNAAVRRSAARVHASTVCASIITRIARARAQSICRRLVASIAKLKGHHEIDVLPHRVPHGTVFFTRQGNRAFDGGGGNAPFDGAVQIDPQKTMRILLRAVAHQMRAKRAQGMATLRE